MSDESGRVSTRTSRNRFIGLMMQTITRQTLSIQEKHTALVCGNAISASTVMPGSQLRNEWFYNDPGKRVQGEGWPIL